MLDIEKVLSKCSFLFALLLWSPKCLVSGEVLQTQPHAAWMGLDELVFLTSKFMLSVHSKKYINNLVCKFLKILHTCRGPGKEKTNEVKKSGNSSDLFAGVLRI